MDKDTNNVPLVFKREVPMEHYFKSNLWGTICGAGAGLGKVFFFLQANMNFLQKLFEAAVTAAICGLLGGLAGAAGKWLWNAIKTKFIKSK
jgi:hypothetical protein